MKFTPIVIIKQLSASIITLLAHRIIRLLSIEISPGIFYLSKLTLVRGHLVFFCDFKLFKEETDLINLAFLLHCAGLAFASACSKVMPFNNFAVGYRVLYHSQRHAWLVFSLIIDSNKADQKTAFVFHV